jgi:endonuclease/exonuclease/phosphatase family metal-dependent hydrolase
MPRSIATIFLLLLIAVSAGADTFRVATYNVENYLDQPTTTRPSVKSVAAKAKVRESIRALNPDVLALEEMGTTNALLELRASLKTDGQDFPYWEYVQGADPDIHLAILSKLPIISHHPHTNEDFLLDGQRLSVKRGFAEVELRAGTNFNFTVISAHLKSRVLTPQADEAAERLAEAQALHEIITARLTADPQVKLIVLGDFNDLRNSDPIKTLIGRGKSKLIDTRPAERNGDDTPASNPRSEPRNITWTLYYNAEDTYSRSDYILISPSLKKFWLPEETYIPTIPNWGLASDHRPIMATFTTNAN